MNKQDSSPKQIGQAKQPLFNRTAKQDTCATEDRSSRQSLFKQQSATSPKEERSPLFRPKKSPEPRRQTNSGRTARQNNPPLFDLTEQPPQQRNVQSANPSRQNNRHPQQENYRSSSIAQHQPCAKEHLPRPSDGQRRILGVPTYHRYQADPHHRYQADPHLMRFGYDEVDEICSQAEYYVASQSILEFPREWWSTAAPQAQRFFFKHPMIIIALVSILILLVLTPVGSSPTWSRWLGPLQHVIRLPFSFAPEPPRREVGDYHIQGSPSLTADEIDMILSSYDSPAVGTGATWVQLGRQRNIDPAFALAFFIHESLAGTHPNWAGKKSDGSITYNVGNIICAGYATCYGRFRDYGSWDEGIKDWYRLIDDEYVQGRGTVTVDQILPIYAPSTENDVEAYIRAVETMVDSWRMHLAKGGFTKEMMIPKGNPLKSPRTVMTQGYGTGSHAPAAVWGAIDLALDGDGDGTADPSGTLGKPVYAVHGGIVRARRNTQPAGNHIWVINQEYKTGYAHLMDFTVEDGQIVRPGEQIGTIGSTGLSSGPHLDYQVWKKQNRTWVNVNPLDFDALSQ